MKTRHLVSCLVSSVLVLVLIWWTTSGIFLFLLGIHPGEDGDFDPIVLFCGSALHFAGAIALGFMLFRYRRHLLPAPKAEPDSRKWLTTDVR